ncbi:nitroreductase family protein [Candidatus Woesearchaeota archaeon]|nr:nitroreductase family protein [Candidatus Woesearchaeota archaeon]
MDTIDCIRTRRSIRKYKDKPVAWDLIGEVLQSALDAPSAGNLQNWKFIVVKDEGKRKKIAEACLEQYWMQTAAVHIIVCAEPEKATHFYGIRGERLYSIQNCACAAQNMMLTAHSLGLGASWVGAFEEDMLKRVLGIPDYVRPQAVITVGYVEESPDKPGKYNLYDMIFLEKWEGRIKDINWVMKEYSTTINRGIAKNAKKAVEEGKKLVEKTKVVVDKIKKKARKI